LSNIKEPFDAAINNSFAKKKYKGMFSGKLIAEKGLKSFIWCNSLSQVQVAIHVVK
jgi:hypothetical protein